MVSGSFEEQVSGEQPGRRVRWRPQAWFGLAAIYPNELARQRAAAVVVMSLLFGVLGVGGVAALVGLSPGLMPRPLAIANIAMALVYLGVVVLVLRGALQPAALTFVVMTLVVPALQTLPFNFVTPEAAALGYVVSVMAASFLLGPGWTWLTGSAAVALTLGGLYVWRVGSLDVLTGAMMGSGDLIGLLNVLGQPVFLLGMLSLLSWLLARNLFIWATNAQRRARQLEGALVVSQTATATQSVAELLAEVVERIRETYGFYHAQVFLLDREGRMARLEASTGAAGQALLGRGHALPVGSRSVVGQATATARPVVVNNVGESSVHRLNDLLPDTRAELALPLIAAGEVIGALDVQSVSPRAFQPDDVRSLEVLASQLAVVIDKARLVDELQARAAENQRLFEDAQRSLAQVEDLNQRVTREGWSEYLRGRRAEGTGYTLHGAAVEADAAWTAPMRQAYSGGTSVVIQDDRHGHIAALPVRVRGGVIGVLEVARSADRPWTDDELAMAETLVERLALAVENARLFEQATHAADREQIVNRITRDIQGASSVDQVLQAALAELAEVLGVNSGVVQLAPGA